MISILTCKKAAVYYNPEKLTISQVKKKTGCTHIINGYVFNNKFESLGWTVIDGEVIAKDKWNDWGFACDKTGAPVMSTDRSKSFLSAIPILKDGARLHRNLTPDIARKNCRTAVAWFPNGRVILLCETEMISRDELQTRLLSLGASDALMFDGGGSTQGIFGDEKVLSTRKVPTMLLFWADEFAVDNDDTVDGYTGTGCPYAEPTVTIRKWSRGVGAKWVQWHLNEHGASLEVDGDFGSASVKALKEFQKKNGLVADGVCGSAVRAALKAGGECPYAEPTTLVKKGSRGTGSKWVQWHLNKHGASLEVDGEFGKLSDIALREFQEKNDLVVDGICGSATRKALKR